jgi:penicillin-insensitive murein DD-endopeptidase
VKGERAWLSKVRPYWGHNYHFHLRIKCQPGSPGCKGQEKVAAGEGCDDSLAWWFTDEPWKPAPKPKKPVKPKPPLRLADLPPACAQILDAPAAAQN